ncbi:hypothetical protein PIB30_086160, partial [Stylosanthes scabra]|nr:hypothetical protein [Stylosanthes scabra]
SDIGNGNNEIEVVVMRHKDYEFSSLAFRGCSTSLFANIQSYPTRSESICLRRTELKNVKMHKYILEFLPCIRVFNVGSSHCLHRVFICSIESLSGKGGPGSVSRADAVLLSIKVELKLIEDRPQDEFEEYPGRGYIDFAEERVIVDLNALSMVSSNIRGPS